MNSEGHKTHRQSKASDIIHQAFDTMASMTATNSRMEVPSWNIDTQIDTRLNSKSNFRKIHFRAR